MKWTAKAGIIIVMIAGILPYAQATEIELDEKLPNDGILTISAGDLGVYKLDTRFNLCFLVPKLKNWNGNYVDGPVVVISCKSFKNLHGNDK